MTLVTKLTFLFITVNLIIAAIMMVAIFGYLGDFSYWIINWPLNLGVGISALYISGYYIGKKMESMIVPNKSSSILTGIIGLLLILLIGIFFGATVGFLQEGFKNVGLEGGLADSLIDYYVKPFYWIIIFGSLPTILSGGILGLVIKKRATTPAK